MSQFSLWRRWLHTALLLAATFTLPVPAMAQSMRPLKLSDLANGADQIFVGQCLKKEAQVRNGTIVTRYTLRPSEMLKGTADPANHGDMIVEEPGGELTTGKVPIGQAVTGQADFHQGEEVLLFTETPKINPKVVAHRAARDASLRNKGVSRKPTFDPKAVRLVGLNQGYYTVITHPETGQKLVAPGEKNPLARIKGSALDRASTATQQRIKLAQGERLTRQLAKMEAAKAAHQKAGLAPKDQSVDRIEPLTSLTDVKAQIALALQKSK